MNFTAGKLIAGRVRRFLLHVKWEHPEFDFYETKGFLSNEFSLKGPTELIERIVKHLENSS